MTQKTKLAHRELTAEIIGSFFTVYNTHGFLEQVNANSLSLELRTRGIGVVREVPVEVQYLGQPVGHYRLDLVVNGLVVVEIKAGAMLVEADRKQLFNYRRAARLEVGLLLYFGPKPEFKRYAIQPGSAVPVSSA